MRTLIICILCITNIIVFTSCGNSSGNNVATQKEENIEAAEQDSLQGITIGKQTWANKNLAVRSFKNGDTIRQAITDEDWQKCANEKIPAWCYYKNDPSNNKVYGKLYNWYAINDARGLAPEGWHIATAEEWQTLEDQLPDSAGWKLKHTIGWEEEAGLNTTGFGAVGGGLRQPEGLFLYLNGLGLWWTTNEKDSLRAIDITMPRSTSLGLAPDESSKGYGYAVRCIKNTAAVK